MPTQELDSGLGPACELFAVEHAVGHALADGAHGEDEELRSKGHFGCALVRQDFAEEGMYDCCGMLLMAACLGRAAIEGTGVVERAAQVCFFGLGAEELD